MNPYPPPSYWNEALSRPSRPTAASVEAIYAPDGTLASGVAPVKRPLRARAYATPSMLARTLLRIGRK